MREQEKADWSALARRGYAQTGENADLRKTAQDIATTVQAHLLQLDAIRKTDVKHDPWFRPQRRPGAGMNRDRHRFCLVNSKDSSELTEHRVDISAVGGSIWSIQGANTDRARQIFPGEQHDVLGGILGTLAAQPSSVDDAIQKFTDHLKKSPAERMVDAWLAQHGVSREEFDAMSPTEKQKLLDEMKRDFEAKMKEKVDGRPESAGTDTVV